MAMETNSKPKIPFFGLLAVKHQFITIEVLQKGISQCSDADDPEIALKEYFLSNELISSQNMERLLRAAKTLEMRQKEFKFGAIAIRKGYISQSVLTLALEEQQNDIKNKRKIRFVGDMLVEAALLSEKQRDHILSLQQRVSPEAQKGEENGKPSAPGDGANRLETEGRRSTDASTRDRSEGEQGTVDLFESEIISGGIKLEISKDFMAAFISKTDEFDKNITLMKIKDALFEKGIILGLTEDKMIEGFINSSGFKTRSFRVAKGVSPVQGKDAKVEFFFHTDYLKAGGLTIDGSIDFKDRGQIPYVEEGTVLAEKIPMKESRQGHTIFGDEIEMIPGNDMALKCGKGARLSEDGCKIIADVKGFPKYTLSGHVLVLQEYVAEGDVDYETGHIHYDGNITIKGRIKSGFKVKGNDIKAIELDGGIITADGDVKILGGINDGKIYARGNVYAKFIHTSQVVCMGNVIVEKEIVDTDVECAGSCIAENGKLISSRISAKMGVTARNIGTERTAPNIIKVGQDVFTEKELEKNRDQTDHLKKQIEDHHEKKDQLKADHLVLQKQITDLAHVQDRSQLEVKEIISKVTSMENDATNTESVKEIKEKIQQLKQVVQTAEKNLDSCFEKSDVIEALMEKESRTIETLEKRGDDFRVERDNLIAWANDNPGKPVVTVTGTLMPETLIRGRHTEKRVTEVIRQSRMMEVLCTSAEGQSLSIYEIQVGAI